MYVETEARVLQPIQGCYAYHLVLFGDGSLLKSWKYHQLDFELQMKMRRCALNEKFCVGRI